MAADDDYGMLVSDEPYRRRDDRNASMFGPGPGQQVTVFEGDGRDTRFQQTPKEKFQRDLIAYVKTAYRSLSDATTYTILEQAERVPNHINLYIGMLVAAILFQQRTNIYDYEQLTPDLFHQHAPGVLQPFTAARLEAKKTSIRNLSEADYMNRLKVDLLRYLRYLLKAGV